MLMMRCEECSTFAWKLHWHLHTLICLSPSTVEYEGQSASGSDVQAAVAENWAHRTVPAVFVKGELLGGCDDTTAAAQSGKLEALLA
eukprot:m.70640 g.70640  ORF g.70640 m.70640 type:complete len:87 (+) comp14082_c0_seq1:114-374(+)